MTTTLEISDELREYDRMSREIMAEIRVKKEQDAIVQELDAKLAAKGTTELEQMNIDDMNGLDEDEKDQFKQLQKDMTEIAPSLTEWVPADITYVCSVQENTTTTTTTIETVTDAPFPNAFAFASLVIPPANSFKLAPVNWGSISAKFEQAGLIPNESGVKWKTSTAPAICNDHLQQVLNRASFVCQELVDFLVQSGFTLQNVTIIDESCIINVCLQCCRILCSTEFQASAVHSEAIIMLLQMCHSKLEAPKKQEFCKVLREKLNESSLYSLIPLLLFYLPDRQLAYGMACHFASMLSSTTSFLPSSDEISLQGLHLFCKLLASAVEIAVASSTPKDMVIRNLSLVSLIAQLLDTCFCSKHVDNDKLFNITASPNAIMRKVVDSIQASLSNASNSCNRLGKINLFVVKCQHTLVHLHSNLDVMYFSRAHLRNQFSMDAHNMVQTTLN